MGKSERIRWTHSRKVLRSASSFNLSLLLLKADRTVSKLPEHEISGDVLLEMDVAMLKEIDLIAFGRRVHIYNAIKELKSRRSLRTSTSTGSMLSPTMSGYEPDSPGTAESPTAYQSPQSRWEQHGHQQEKLAGLGLDNDSAASSSVRAPSSVRLSSDASRSTWTDLILCDRTAWSTFSQQPSLRAFSPR